MTMDETASTRRSVHSHVPLLRNAVCVTGLVKSAEFAPSGSRVNGALDFVDNAPTRPLFEAIGEQRLSVLNVLGIVRCIGFSVTSADQNPAPEISAAFALLECEIQRIATALEKISLRSAGPHGWRDPTLSGGGSGGV
jgi:hypothetical protein